MTIHLPPHLESSLQAAVQSGRFTSLDDALARAATLLLEELGQEPTEALASAVLPPDPLLGVWRDAADEIDEIVADAYRRRREEPWRTIAGE